MDPTTITSGFFNPTQWVEMEEENDNDGEDFSLSMPIPQGERTEARPPLRGEDPQRAPGRH